MLAVPLLCSASLSAQNPEYSDHRNRKVDSLEQVLATNPPMGAELGNIYNELMWGYTYTDNKKAMDYARKLIALSESLNSFYELARTYGHAGMLFYGASRYDSAHYYYDRALETAARLKTAKNSNGKPYTEKDIDVIYARLYGNIGNLYNIQGKNHEAIEYYTKALKLFEKHGWKESLTFLYGNIAEMYLGMDNYEQAELNYIKSSDYALQTGDSLMIARAGQGLSNIYLQQKNYGKALEYAEASRRYIFAHPEEGESYKVFAFNLFAQIYLDGYNDIDKAENYVRQALQIADCVLLPNRY
jgi:tetratricopeptide (TPR) repeat protein